ncbi:MAG: ABC transporter ATP-binding protein, partial [Actinomycetaceae bacterium]|nr:ABC transporter ATP-binding protein [Actinomycetaceae bacterium]
GVQTGVPAPLQNVTLDIEQGSCVLLCGASGSGKTTLTRLINGLIPHYWDTGILEGTVKVDGVDVVSSTLFEISKRVASVFQNPRSQFFNVDVASEVAFTLENHGVDVELIKEKVSHAAHVCNVKHLLGCSIFELSGGQKQKIACACAHASDAKIFLFDEPSANLDYLSMRDIHAMMKQLKESGATVIVAEHRLHWITDLIDRAIYMENGRVAGDWNGEEFRSFSLSRIDELGLRPLTAKHFLENAQCLSVEENNTLRYTQSDGKSSQQSWRVENLSFTYKHSISGIDIKKLDIQQNKITGIIGSNGAGKSTFLRCMCGLEKHSSGILVSPDGKKFTGRKRVNQSYMVFQDVNHQLFTEYLPDEILLSMPIEDEKKADELLEVFSLSEYRQSHPLGLSGGQKQRLAVASAIASERPLLLFDEPTSGLDSFHMKTVADQLRDLAHLHDKTVLLVSHDVELLLACADNIVRLEDGTVTEEWEMNTESARLRLVKIFLEQLGMGMEG